MVYVCVCMCTEARGGCYVNSSIIFHLISLRQGLSLNMELAVFQLAWLAIKPQRYSCLPILTNTGVTDVLTTTLGFYMDAEGLN